VKSPDGSDRWLSERETARLIGMSRAWLQRERVAGKGIPYAKLNRAVRYRLSDIVGWMEGRKCRAQHRLNASESQP
jgi:predicted DNA-binding transcriptional regulator AlpA